jgi:hypothetical protein
MSAAVIFAADSRAVVLETTATSASVAPIGFSQSNGRGAGDDGAPRSMTCYTG